jgi:hypothetical protein
MKRKTTKGEAGGCASIVSKKSDTTSPRLVEERMLFGCNFAKEVGLPRRVLVPSDSLEIWRQEMKAKLGPRSHC